MILHGDCQEKLKRIIPCSVDSIITDPPAGIAFMGKDWDKDKGGRDGWIQWLEGVMVECHRVMKPGAHGFVWALPRTSHWTATALENAGFEIRDIVTHVFGSGFPKSHNISKGLDKMAGAEREVVGPYQYPDGIKRTKLDAERSQSIPQLNSHIKDKPRTAPATDAAKKWDGWGTALKPASEHWILVRKPFKGTVAKNVMEHGTGGINIDASRVGSHDPELNRKSRANKTHKPWGTVKEENIKQHTQGRFPSNLICSGDAREMLDEQSLAGGMHSAGKSRSGGKSKQEGEGGLLGVGNHKGNGIRFGDSGGASRFFYCAKASKSERGSDNNHPTVKALKLMKYLITMITPPGGTVLDPFMGSGSTCLAAASLGFRFIGIEQNKEYFDIANARLQNKEYEQKSLSL